MLLTCVQIVSEMASAAGLPCDIDPALCAALRAQKTTKEIGEDDYVIACLMMVFVAVSIPRLASAERSFFKAGLEGRPNTVVVSRGATSASLSLHTMTTLCSCSLSPR